jgi:predicted RNA-binding protein
MDKNGENELIMEDVELFEVSEGQVRLVNIFGEEKKLKAKVKTLYLVDHKIILESI